VSAKVGFTCAVREVPDEQTDCQDLLVKTACYLDSEESWVRRRPILTQRWGSRVKQGRDVLGL
jgi:hypothetical protein